MKQKVVKHIGLGVYIFFGLALVVMVNYLGFRHYFRHDMTKEKIYSLSEESEKVLKGLNKDVVVYVLFNPINPIYDNLRELLERYKTVSPHVQVKYLDVEKNPLEAEKLVKELNITSNNVVVVKSGEKKKFLYQSDLAEMDYQGIRFGQSPRVKSFKGEGAITSAILNVSEEKQLHIGFLTAHGEKSIDDFNNEGLSALKDELEKENYKVSTVSLLGKEKFPPDINLLVIPGPKLAFLSQELELLDSFLQKGGRLLVLYDPILKEKSFGTTGLEKWLTTYGIEVVPCVVIDPGQTLPFFGPETIYVSNYRSHAITNKLKKYPTIFPIMAAVRTANTDKEGVKSQILMESTNKAWGEKDLKRLLTQHDVEKNDTDLPAPVPLGAVSEKEKGFRIVVIGDSDFMTNGQINNLGNALLALYTIHWLAQQEERIAIPPKALEQVRLALSAKQMRTLFFITVIGMPLFGILLGIIIWRRRRK